MDRIQDTHKRHDQFISDEILKEIWGLTETNSALRSWVIDLKIYEMHSHKERRDGKFVFIKDDKYQDLWSFLQHDFDFFKAFFSKFESMSQQAYVNDPRSQRGNGSTCVYHTHSKGDCALLKGNSAIGAKQWVDDITQGNK